MMKQCMTVLITTQDELSNVYKARRKDTIGKNIHVTIFTTENEKLDEKINAIINHIADQNAQTESNCDDDSNATVGITTIGTNRGKKIAILFLIHNLIDCSKKSFCAAIKNSDCQNQDSAQAYKITESTKDQLKSFYRNSDNLEDLQNTGKQNEESIHQYLLESFTSCNINDVATDVQCDNYKNPITKDKNPTDVNLCDSLKLKKNEKSQHYRTILDDKNLNKKAINDENLAQANSLLAQSEELRKALQQAADFNMTLLTNSVVDLNEILTTETESNEKAILDQHEKKLQKLRETEIDNLKMKERHLENQQRIFDQRMQQLISREEDFERYKKDIRNSLKEERILMDRQRHCIQQDRNDFLMEKKELERLDDARADSYRGKERTLDDQRRNLEQEKHEFIATKENFEQVNDVNATRLKLREISLEQEKMDLEYTKLELSTERERLRQKEIFDAARIQEKERSLEKQEMDLENAKSNLLAEKERLRQQEISNANNLQQRERMLEEKYEKKISNLDETRTRMQRNYEMKIGQLRELDDSMEHQRRELQRYQQTLLEQKQEVDEYCQSKTNSLREQERNMDRQRQNLERDSDRLKKKEKNQQQDITEYTPICATWDGSFEIPIIPYFLSWKVRLPS